MTLILLIVIGPWLLSRVIHHWVDWKHLSAPKRHEESDIERKLNDMQADLRFESTWNLSSAEESQSRENPRWQTPEEMLLEDKLKRTDKDSTAFRTTGRSAPRSGTAQALKAIGNYLPTPLFDTVFVDRNQI
jgi:hypothetical protein